MGAKSAKPVSLALERRVGITVVDWTVAEERDGNRRWLRVENLYLRKFLITKLILIDNGLIVLASLCALDPLCLRTKKSIDQEGLCPDVVDVAN